MNRTRGTVVGLLAGVVTLLWPGTAWNAPGAEDAVPQLFQHSSRCQACHNGLTAPDGRDVSVGVDWRSSMMANAARDPYWQGAVRREITDHPAAQAAIEDECTKCHLPMARFLHREIDEQGVLFDHLTGIQDPGLTTLGMDGVSCTLCHQIQADNLGEEASLVGGFEIDTATAWGSRAIRGPFEVDEGRTRIMNSASEFDPTAGPQMKSSDLCATCHTLITHALGPGGVVIGELPEQVPYQEWEHSAYFETRSCQQCHMPALEQPAAISSVWPQDRDGVSPHVFHGGNFVIPRMLNEHRAELGTVALPAEQSATADRSAAHVQAKAAEVTVDDVVIEEGQLVAEITVRNRAGHKFPTAYPSRRAWLHVSVDDAGGQRLFESGAFAQDGSIEGNDNDQDASSFEPHHLEITRGDQVQIYEPILTDVGGEVTTGLLSATAYAKDNRLLPEGFDKTTAHEWVDVHGLARDDADFTASGDTTRYRVDLGGAAGPFHVSVELWFQPIGYRWAENFRGTDAVETQRFVGYYDEMAATSAVVVAEAAVRVDEPPPPAVEEETD